MAHHHRPRWSNGCSDYCVPGHATAQRIGELLGGMPASEAKPAAGARRRRRLNPVTPPA